MSESLTLILAGRVEILVILYVLRQ
jgi:hypothetical protein